VSQSDYDRAAYMVVWWQGAEEMSKPEITGANEDARAALAQAARARIALHEEELKGLGGTYRALCKCPGSQIDGPCDGYTDGPCCYSMIPKDLITALCAVDAAERKTIHAVHHYRSAVESRHRFKHAVLEEIKRTAQDALQALLRAEWAVVGVCEG